MTLPLPPSKLVVDLVGLVPVLLMFAAQALAADRLWFATNLAFTLYHLAFTRLWSLLACSTVLLAISGYRAFLMTPSRREVTTLALRRALAAYGRAHLELEAEVGHVPQLDAVRKQHLDAVAHALGERP